MTTIAPPMNNYDYGLEMDVARICDNTADALRKLTDINKRNGDAVPREAEYIEEMARGALATARGLVKQATILERRVRAQRRANQKKATKALMQ